MEMFFSSKGNHSLVEQEGAIRPVLSLGREDAQAPSEATGYRRAGGAVPTVLGGLSEGYCCE